MRAESQFENGEKVGVERSYNADGKIKMERVYSKGTPKQVKVSWFYPNNKIKIQMLYENNQALWQKSYNELGEITAKLDCKAENCLSGLSEIIHKD